MPTEKVSWRFYYFCRALCRIFCAVFFKMHVTGLENIPGQGGVVFICNHQSYLDPLFCGIKLKRPIHFIARRSLLNHPVFGAIIKALNIIPIKRGKPDLSAIKLSIKRLKQEQIICLFPEGTRTSDGKIAPLKPGFSFLCIRAKVPIVPVLVEGAFDAWPRHKKLFRPGSIFVQYGKPIPYQKLQSLTDRQCTEMLTETLRKMQNETRIQLEKNTTI